MTCASTVSLQPRLLSAFVQDFALRPIINLRRRKPSYVKQHPLVQVYVPDDDIVQLGSSINKAFDLQEVYGLELAQPSLCSRVESDSVHGQGMYMEGPTVLRYGTFVEIMVPLFSMNFFKGNVTDTLSTSASGAVHLHCSALVAVGNYSDNVILARHQSGHQVPATQVNSIQTGLFGASRT